MIMRLALCAVVACLLAGPAWAKPGSAECLWNHSPEASRTSVTASLRSNPPSALNDMRDPKLLGPAMAACGVDPSKQDQAMALWSLVVFRHNFLTELSSQTGVSEERILAAVAAMPDDDRRALAQFMETQGRDDPNGDILDGIARRLQGALGMDEAAFETVRSLLEVIFITENLELKL
jgi:hypothetical protein